MTPADALFDRELRAWARDRGNAELLDRVDVLALADDPFDNAFPGADIERERNRCHREVLRSELQRRRRVAAMRADGSRPDAERYRSWCDLAREVRARLDLPWLFDRLGYGLTPAGRNGRRGADEWAGACPLCGGTDRLRVWSGPNGRAWCRRCGWSADAIVAAQSLDRSLVGFYRAVAFLAAELGIAVPPDPVAIPPTADALAFPSGATFAPIRKEGRRAG